MIPSPTSRSRPLLFSGLRRIAPVCVGGFAGACLFVWVHQFLAAFGVSLPVTGGLTMAASGTAALCWWSRRSSSPPALVHYGRSFAWLTIAVWTVGYSVLIAGARSLMGLIPAQWMEVEATAFTVMLVIASGLFAPPLAALACLGNPSSLKQRCRSDCQFPLSVRFLVGCGFALGTTPVLLTPWMSVQQIGIGVAALSVVALWINLNEAAGRPSSARSHDGMAAPSVVSNRSQTQWVGVASLLAGLQVPVVHRVVMQFVPGSSFVHFAFWSGLLCGIAAGHVWAVWVNGRQRETISRDNVLAAGLIVAVWPVALLLLCPVLLQGMLTLNTYVSHVPTLTAVRWLMATLSVFPLGLAMGRVWTVVGPSLLTAVRPTVPCSGLVLLAAGLVLMKSLWVPPGISLPLLLFCGMALMTARFWTLDRAVVQRRHWLTGALAAALIASLPLVRQNYRPDLAAKLLFSTQTLAAHKSGIDSELLPHLDDGRLVTLRDGRDSVWSVWKHRGSQLLFRQSGVPVGITCTNPSICPQFAGDVMPAVVPLVVHPHPESVLVVGLGSSATLATCSACPVRKVTCVEGDEDLIQINDDVIAPASASNPLSDDRVHLRALDPTLYLLADGPSYDVVILSDSQPSLLRQTSRFTREFYQRVSRRLNARGLVCQRLQYADFGREAVENIVGTLRSVFSTVVCLESAPGEMVLLASNSDEPLFDESLLERCEAAHVRRLLAQLGWDWSVMLNLAAIGPQQVDELCAHNVTTNTVANGNFAYTLPQEVMRCEPKWREIRGLLSERGSRMLAWLGDSPEVNDVKQRLADVTEQQRLIVEHPDRFWTYRKTLKERLKDRPRSEIVPVKHELKRALHPEDKRRKDYLEALGAAATKETPHPEDIARINEFAEPYDPLVSYFLHEEAARLYERAESSDQTAQFDHLRYSIHFGPSHDRSVRNVIAALQLLVEQPQLLPDPRQRWDEMNALLDVLRQRSRLRVQTDNSASPFKLVDAEKSIQIAERAMNVMDDLHAAADVPTADWQQRRTVLQRMLIRPMWTYHSQQAKRLEAVKARPQQTVENETKPTKTQ